MAQVIRTAEEVEQVMAIAQKLSFTAEDAGSSDDVAEFAYQYSRWLLGHEDQNPGESLIEGTALDTGDE
jgi:hypothetical protein